MLSAACGNVLKFMTAPKLDCSHPNAVCAQALLCVCISDWLCQFWKSSVTITLFHQQSRLQCLMNHFELQDTGTQASIDILCAAGWTRSEDVINTPSNRPVCAANFSVNVGSCSEPDFVPCSVYAMPGKPEQRYLLLTQTSEVRLHNRFLSVYVST